MAYTLIFFGSGQQMTHQPTQNQPYGDTLSLMHDLLPAQKVKEVVGPQGVFGLNANTYVAHGVMNILQQAAQGETTIHLTAHSRGSCEALLCAHEIDRIQKTIRKTGTAITVEQLKAIISASPNTAIARGLRNMLQSALQANEDPTALCEQILQININLQMIDPVPGRHMSRLVHWYDKRFTQKIPSVVNRALVLYAEHERTCAFSPIVPNTFLKTNQNTKVRADLIPGMHGTAGGHLFLHAGRSTPKNWDPKKVKDAQLITLYRFIEEQMATDPTVMDTMLKKMAYIRKTRGPEIAVQLECFLKASKMGRQFLYMAAYERVQNNEAAYQVLAQGGYGGDKGGQFLMWHENGPDRAIFTKSGERKLLKQSLGTTSTQYVNKHHAEIAVRVRHYNSLPLLQRLEKALQETDSVGEKSEIATRIVEQIVFGGESESDLKENTLEVTVAFDDIMSKVNADFKRLCQGGRPQHYTVQQLVRAFNDFDKNSRVLARLDLMDAEQGVAALKTRIGEAAQYANETPFSVSVAEDFVSAQAELTVLKKRLERYLEEMHYLSLYSTVCSEAEQAKFAVTYQRMQAKVLAVKKQLADFVPQHLQSVKALNAANVHQAAESIERFQAVLAVFEKDDPEWVENLRETSTRLQVQFFYEHLQCLSPKLHEKAKALFIRLEKQDHLLYAETQSILRQQMGNLDAAALGLNSSFYLYSLVRSLFQLLNYVGCDIAPPQPCVIQNIVTIKAAYKQHMDVVNAVLEDNKLMDAEKGVPAEFLKNIILELENLCNAAMAVENKNSYFSEKWGWYSETTVALQSLCATLQPIKQKCLERLKEENGSACLLQKTPATYLSGKTGISAARCPDLLQHYGNIAPSTRRAGY